jgi:cytolysin (calcineurin-like family phosphatase)
MFSDHPPISRRAFLASGAAGMLVVAGRGAEPKAPQAEPFSFFVIGDTHYLVERQKPGKLDERSALTTANLVKRLNGLPGTPIPEQAGGGTVASPRGLIHAGDLIDSGDKTDETGRRMQKEEWKSYSADFGLDGKDGKLKYPVYEVHGNHDAPQGNGLVVEQITDRNKKRPGVSHVSKNGLHYSWDWGNVHFVNLGIVVGAVKGVKRKRRYAPLESLDFLETDLADKVGKSGRPVVLTHHVDVLRYALNPDPDAPGTNKEWDPCDVRAYYDLVKGYNVVAIFYGHTHSRNIFRWDGTAKRAMKGIPVFNVAKASHFNGKEQALFYCQVTDRELIVREHVTPDRWESAHWTPQVWKVPLAGQGG